MKEIIDVFLLSMVPLIEQRGAIPLGILLHQMNPFAVFAISFLGSLVPVPFILFFFSYIFEWLGKTRILRWFYDFIDKKVQKGRDKVERYEKWGLILFVAIPLPTTGLWTGSAVAAFLRMDKRKAALYIIAGGFISAVVITVLSVVFPAILSNWIKGVEMDILADDHVKINYLDNGKLSSYSPGICIAENGRIIVTAGTSGSDEAMAQFEVKGRRYGGYVQGRIFVSDDGGITFRQTKTFPFMHARPFTAGKSIYVLGQCNDLMIIRSDDNGETWSEPCKLTEGEDWHQAPCNVEYRNGFVYIVMEKRSPRKITGWMVNNIAPVLMRGRTGDDLTDRESWTFASELYFDEAVCKDELDYHGIPFHWTTPDTYVEVAPGRGCAEIGWLETNIVILRDRNHYLYDRDTIHLYMRAHTGMTNYGAIAKVIENGDGSMTTMLEKVPSGKKLVYLPIPGGQMKFHIIFDETSGLYWLLSTQSTDSMTRADVLPPERYNLPDNERRRLVLHFSRNCFDWCFAGVVAMGEEEKMSRHYAAMAVRDNDLLVVSRSGDEKAISAHDTNFVSFHRIRDFRGLVY